MSASTAEQRAHKLVQHLADGAPDQPSYTIQPSSTPDIICHTYPNGLAHLILNRPAAYNALTLDMCTALHTTLLTLLTPPTTTRVVLLTSSHPCGVFCTGGDVRAVTGLLSVAQPVSSAAWQAFFRVEYRLDALLAAYPLPVVALMDGAVMGGGCGLALHCRHRVATRRTRLAMPECSIGLVPDVGGTHFLARWPGAVGMWAALTSSRLDGADAMYVGAATEYVDAAHVGDLVHDLQTFTGWGHDRRTVQLTVQRRLRRWHWSGWQAAPGYVERHRANIDRCFAHGTLHALLVDLTSLAHPTAATSDPGLTAFARRSLAQLAAQSPTSLQLTHAALTRSAALRMSLARCLQLEYRLVCRLCREPRGGDFAVGVKAVLVEKRRGGEGGGVPWVSGWRSSEEVEWFMSGLSVDVEGDELRFDDAESAERLAARLDESWTKQAHSDR